MNIRPLPALLIGIVLALLPPVIAQDTPAAPAASPIQTDLMALVKRIGVKIKTGERTAAALAPELAAFDALLVKYPEKSDATAEIALMKAWLFVQVLNDEAKGRELLLAVQQDFAGTKSAGLVAGLIGKMDEAAARKAKLAAFVGSPAPELHFNWSTQADLRTLSDLKGRVVVLDFWATWCGPCIASFPQIREHVAHFKGRPVTFLGVTSLQGHVANMGPRIDTRGDPAKEYALMTDFMKAKDMTWDVAFSEEQVFNPEYGIQGIPYVAIIAPDGTVRHTGLHPGDPAGDIAGKVEALLQEFNLAAPQG